MPRVEDVQLELFGVKERVVGTLARDEGVETGSGGLRDHGARSPRHDPDAAHPLRAERQQPRCGARDGRQLALERVPRDVDLSPPADPHAVFFAEIAAQRDAKLPREHRVVADLGMQIECQVSTVERDVLRDESRHAPIRAPCEGLEPTPEQAMVDEQEIGSLLRRHPYGRLTQVDCRRDTAHRPRVRDLQPVDRVGSVRHFGDSEIAIQVRDQRRELH